MLTKKKRTILFWLSIAAFFIILAPVLIYSSGYRIGPNFTLIKTGGIYVKTSISGAMVSIDGTKKKSTSLISGSALIKNIGPGIHRTVVSHDRYLDWKKNLEVETEMVTSREVLLVPAEIKGEMLGTTTIPVLAEYFLKKNSLYGYDENKKEKVIYTGVKKYWFYEGRILIFGEDGNLYLNGEPFNVPESWGLKAGTILKSKSNSFFANNKSRLIYWDDAGIDSYWIEDINKLPQWQNPKALSEGVDRYLHIYSTDESIRAVYEYPGYSDYLLAEISNGIFVLEMEAEGGQNIFPLYKGKNPKIVWHSKISTDRLLILDDGNYIVLELP